MKTDRLYALTLYLLNHGKSSASEEAKTRSVLRNLPVTTLFVE